MQCTSPFTKGPQAYACGQCMLCRINRRRLWTHRIMLEASQYNSNAFVTLTYDDASLPLNSIGTGSSAEPLSTLEPKHLQSWLKRFRKAWYTQTCGTVRFYAVGEYGDESWRPHYHVALFGAACERGRTIRVPGTSRPDWSRCCPVCKMVGETWGFGDVDVGNLETSSAQYLAGYVTKKMTRNDDPRLLGRHREFARMSLRPGIGFNAMHDLADVLLSIPLNLVDTQGDVPSALRHGKRLMPLGRYLRSKLRLMVGRDEKTPQATLDEFQEEVRDVFDAAFNSTKEERGHKTVKEYFAELVSGLDDGRRASILARAKIMKQRKTL